MRWLGFEVILVRFDLLRRDTRFCFSLCVRYVLLRVEVTEDVLDFGRKFRKLILSIRQLRNFSRAAFRLLKKLEYANRLG